MSQAGRRPVRYRSPADLIRDVEHLRDAGYARLGNWSLEQMCFHLGRPVARPIPSLSSDPDPEKSAALVTRLRSYIDTGHPPAGASAPPGSEPPADPGPGVIDDFIERVRGAAVFTGEFVDFGPRGAIPGDMLLPFLLAHAAHHLSLLVPNDA